MLYKKTRRLDEVQDGGEPPAPSKADGLDMGMLRPWRIALRIKQMHVQLIFDLVGSLLIGRTDPDDRVFPDIDLGPFRAGEAGVSREHLTMHLNGNTVVVVDRHSANGTKLNGRRLDPGQEYQIRHGDELMLGALAIQVELLINPLE
jgi:hypothetical protein